LSEAVIAGKNQNPELSKETAETAEAATIAG
jgi:hypothetical protein